MKLLLRRKSTYVWCLIVGLVVGAAVAVVRMLSTIDRYDGV